MIYFHRFYAVYLEIYVFLILIARHHVLLSGEKRKKGTVTVQTLIKRSVHVSFCAMNQHATQGIGFDITHQFQEIHWAINDIYDQYMTFLLL